MQTSHYIKAVEEEGQLLIKVSSLLDDTIHLVHRSSFDQLPILMRYAFKGKGIAGVVSYVNEQPKQLKDNIISFYIRAAGNIKKLHFRVSRSYYWNSSLLDTGPIFNQEPNKEISLGEQNQQLAIKSQKIGQWLDETNQTHQLMELGPIVADGRSTSLEEGSESSEAGQLGIGEEFIMTNSSVRSSKKAQFSNQKIGENKLREIISYEWTALESIVLKNCQIGNEGIKIFTSKPWAFLALIELRGNLISTLDHCTPENILNTQQLGLRGNKLTELPERMSCMKKLSTINIHENQFARVPPVLRHFPELKHLWIKGNKIPNIDQDPIILELKAKINDIDFGRLGLQQNIP